MRGHCFLHSLWVAQAPIDQRDYSFSGASATVKTDDKRWVPLGPLISGWLFYTPRSLGVDRDPPFYLCAEGWFRPYCELAAHRPQTLPHADQPEAVVTSFVLWIESDSVVGNE